MMANIEMITLKEHNLGVICTSDDRVQMYLFYKSTSVEKIARRFKKVQKDLNVCVCSLQDELYLCGERIMDYYSQGWRGFYEKTLKIKALVAQRVQNQKITQEFLDDLSKQIMEDKK